MKILLLLHFASYLLFCNFASADFLKGLEAAQQGDYSTALAEWTPLAQKGNADAQYNLGVMYHKGYGVTSDHVTAAKWYLSSAMQGNVNAQHALGQLYVAGLGVTQDYTLAAKWYRLAAEQGHANSQYNLGLIYDGGYGIPHNHATAAKWYILAANQNHADAQNNLGILYEKGLGVTQNKVIAIKLYKLSSEQGYAPAKVNLNRALRRGLAEGDKPDQEILGIVEGLVSETLRIVILNRVLVVRDEPPILYLNNRGNPVAIDDFNKGDTVLIYIKDGTVYQIQKMKITVE